MKIYLVNLCYYNTYSNDYESSMDFFNEVIAAFNTEDKAKEFCINNSDEIYENEFKITKQKKLMNGDECIYDLNTIYHWNEKDEEYGIEGDYCVLGIKEIILH